MNFGSIFNSDANIFHQKVGKLIEKTNYFPFNTNDRIYNFLVQVENSSNEKYNQIIVIGSDTYIYKFLYKYN
jgi:hypothetical protein